MLTLNGQFNIDTSVVRGDKSICHRALIFASVANGKSVIRNLTVSRDVLATVNCLRTLGAAITIDGSTAIVEPITRPCDNVTLDCGNSGTTARLIAGLAAGLGIRAKFIGDASLSKRPMDRVIEPLKNLGANFRMSDDCLFESLGGHLRGGQIVASVNSAQVKSAVLIAGLFAEGVTTYTEQLPTRNHTELMLENLGANIQSDGQSTSIAKSVLKPLDIDIPRDISSMAFLIGVSLICGRQIVCSDVLLNERRVGFLRVLCRSGADIVKKNVHITAGEQVGDIAVNTSRLKPLFADMTDVCDSIDELPILAAIALTVKGTHVFNGVAELQHKESDRIKAIIDTAKICNQEASFDGEKLTIVSNGKLPKSPRFASFDDHRIAMAQAALCLAAGGGSIDKSPYDVSFPQFDRALGVSIRKLGLIGCDIENSRSPLLMEHFARQAGINCSYDLIPLSKSSTDCELMDVINRFDGLNVTMPFKTRIAGLLRADCCSVNTVGKKIKPQSTDGYGIIQALKSCNADYSNKRLWIVGAGGAAISCIETLLKYNCQIQVVNRTQSHADELTRRYRLSTDITQPYGVLSFVPECDFEQSLILPDGCKFVFVASYKGRSGLKAQALKRGITYVDGLRMLYYQGAKSFSLWTDSDLYDDYDSFVRFVNEGVL